MPYRIKTHEENRDLVCAICLEKSGSSARRLSDTNKEILTKNVFVKFFRYEDSFPSSLCGKCRPALMSYQERWFSVGICKYNLCYKSHDLLKIECSHWLKLQTAEQILQRIFLRINFHQ